MYKTTTSFGSSNAAPSTIDLTTKLQLVKQEFHKNKEQRSPSRCTAVSAEVYGTTQNPMPLKESPEEDRRLALAKAKFQVEWGLLRKKDVVVPQDGSTLKLLYGTKHPRHDFIFLQGEMKKQQQQNF